MKVKQAIEHMFTLSFHQEGDGACTAHNRRIRKSTSNPDIDWDKTEYNITLADMGLRQAYRKLFDDSVEEFNSRQKNLNRRIRNYYDKINQDSKKHTHYEIIVQLGGMKEGYPDNATQLLMNYAVDFMSRNPNLYVYGAYIHVDEKGAPHLHLDYIPFAECNRGMKIQNTLTGALKAQGFVTIHKDKEHPDIKFESAQMQWEKAERQHIRQMCENMKISLHAEGIGRKRHFSVPEYKELQEKIKSLELDASARSERLHCLDAELQQKSRQVSTLSKKVHELEDLIDKTVHSLEQAESVLSWDSYWQATYEKIPDYYKNNIDVLLGNHQKFYDDVMAPQHDIISDRLEELADLQQEIQYLDDEMAL